MQLANYRPPLRDDMSDAPPSDPVEREAALSGVLDEVLADADAATAAPAALYQDFILRCRVRRLENESIGLPEFKRRLAARRAGGAAPDGPEWQRAQAVAAALPDDLAGPFLLIARAAIEGAPCPSDAELAEAYGTSSAGRARRMLAYLEERGAIVQRRDLRGAPIIAVPDLGVETAPGEPRMAAQGGRR